MASMPLHSGIAEGKGGLQETRTKGLDWEEGVSRNGR